MSSDGSQKEKMDPRERAYISVYFKCCRTFARIYKNKDGTAYVGWCPKCLAKVTARCGRGEEGTDQRIFQTT